MSDFSGKMSVTNGSYGNGSADIIKLIFVCACSKIYCGNLWIVNTFFYNKNSFVMM
jgi:hypothetical protein